MIKEVSCLVSVLLLHTIISNNTLAQSVTKHGESTSTSSNFVNKNGQIGNAGVLSKYGKIQALATLTTTPASAITSTTASSGGNITSDGGTSVTARGVCWSTSTGPTTALSTKTSDGTGTGTFTSSITGLAAGTTYYVRAYATNSVGTAYGNEVSFTTAASLPTVTTTAISLIINTTAASGGNVTSSGGGTVIARGVCWSITTNPTITDNKSSDDTGTGSFTSSITSLTAGTTYHVRSYATNSAGTAYGNELDFTTTTTTITLGTTYAGGIIFYIDGTGQHGLTASSSDQSSSAQWGCINTVIPDTQTSIGTGNGNTISILKRCGQSGIAAKICYDLTLNGYDDWYLPSKDELNQMYINLYLKGFGSFSARPYWTSTEDPGRTSGDAALYQYFGDGGQGPAMKSNTDLFTRAIRSF